MKIALPRYLEDVAPCFDYSVNIVVFTVRDKEIEGQREFTLSSQWAVDRIRLLRDQKVDVLICGGIQDRFEDMVKANGIEVISWVSGRVNDLLERYMNNTLKSERTESQ